MHNLPAEKNRRVLIIDDNPAIHDDFRKILSPAITSGLDLDEAETAIFGEPTNAVRQTSFVVDSAYQGQAGMLLVQKALAEGLPYSLAFVDIRMPPGWDGVETTRKIWELDSEVQIVLCTAYSDYSWDEMYDKLGYRDGLLILKKPFDTVEALQLAQALTEKWWLHRQSLKKMEDLESVVARRTQELDRSFSLLNATFESMLDGIVAVDLSGKVTSYNSKFVATWQFPSEMLARQDVAEMRDFTSRQIKDPARFLERIKELQANPETELYDAFELKDGRTFERYVFPQRLGGECVGRVINWRDVTARNRAEAQLVHSQKMESIGQLAAGIAHEINSPMQYIGDNTKFVKESFEAISKVLQGQAELIAAVETKTVTPELLARNGQIVAACDLNFLCTEIPAALSQTIEGVERVSKIVRAMKEFSHPGGKEKINSDLNKAIESTVTVAHNEWRYVADVKLELEADLPLVPCFLGEFNQCILNLIVNAAHAIGDVVQQKPGTKGLITIRTRRDNDHVEVRVTDTGTGIPEGARSKIFEPFFTTKEVGKGTGQGLSIIYANMVKNHGGTVTFETEIAKGTSFILRLPMVAERVCIAVTDKRNGIQPENRALIFAPGFTIKKEGQGFGLHSGALAAKGTDGSLNVHGDGSRQGATSTLKLPCTSNRDSNE